MREVALRSGDWSHGPVMEAEGFLDRLRGLRASGRGSSLLLETSSVHGIGLEVPFRAVALTRDLRVGSVTIVYPGRVVRFRGCAYVLEMPVHVTPPAVGALLEVIDA